MNLSIDVQPASLAFVSATLDPLEQTIQVTNTGTDPLHIRSVTLTKANDVQLPAAPGLLSIACTGAARTTPNPDTIAPGQCAQVVVQYAPQPGENITNDVLIASDATNSPLVTVPVTAVNTIVVCPPPDQFVASIQAASNSGPLAPSGTVLPGTVTFTSMWSAANPAITVTDYSWTVISAPPLPNAMVANGTTASLVATASGSYEVGLTLVDNQGCASAETGFSFTVVVPPCQGIEPPTAVLSATVGSAPLTPAGVRAQTTVDFNALDSVGGSEPITGYQWSFVSAPPGNESKIVASGGIASVDFITPGTYLVGVTISDWVGCQSAVADVKVIVAPLPFQECGPSSKFIYNVDEGGVLYKFDPSTVTMTTLGNINCTPATDTATPNTMAVDRQGTAWVEYSDGSLFQVDTTTLDCFPTSLVQTNTANDGWGSCFAAGGVDGGSDTYYIAENGELATVDTSTLTLRFVGQFIDPSGQVIQSQPELSGTADGRLFGLFPGEPWTVDQLNRTDAAALSVTPEPAITAASSGASNWAFASWGEDFWFFVGNGSPTIVYHDDADAGTTTAVLMVPAAIVGAGVSPCAQTAEGN